MSKSYSHVRGNMLYSLGLVGLMLLGATIFMVAARSKQSVQPNEEADQLLAHRGSLPIPYAGSEVLWDFVVRDNGLHFLLSDPRGSNEYVHTDVRGNVLVRVALPFSPTAVSGCIAVNSAGVVGILRRAMRRGQSDLLLYSRTGSLVGPIMLGEVILELAFIGDRLIGASWTHLYVLPTELAGKASPLTSFQPPLSYPFSLLPTSAGTLAVLEFTDAILRFVSVSSVSQATVSQPTVLSAPEVRERPHEAALEGAGVLWGAAVSGEGQIYCGLPNFRPSKFSRLLVMDPGGRKQGVWRIALPMPEDGASKHIHPVKVRVVNHTALIAALHHDKIEVYSQ